MQVYVISLKDSVDRQKSITAQCEKLDINPIFIEAVNGKNLSKSEISQYCNQEKAKQLFGRELLLGEIGCALSHLNIYQKMLDDNISCAVIFEDDAIIKSNFANSIELILNRNLDWDLILLGHNKGFKLSSEISSIKSNWGVKKLDKKTSIGRIVRGGLGCYGYMINQEGAKKLLSYVEENSIVYPIDKMTSNYDVVNFYGVFPTVVSIESNFESSIDNNGNRQNDRDGEIVHEIGKLIRKTPFFNMTRALWFQYLKIKPIKK